jgi:heme exporter protein C
VAVVLAMAREDLRFGERRLAIAGGLAGVGFLVLPFAIAGAPLERVMGPIQKIFYFHVPCCWILMVSTLVLGGASVRQLFARTPQDKRADAVAVASCELGVLFGLCGLVSGPLWARVAWGKFWTWDARQTTTLLLFLTLLAYLLARRYGGPAARTLAAALGIFAAANVPLVYASATWWRTLHPNGSVVPTLHSAMRPALYGSLLVLLLVWALLFATRLRLQALVEDLADLEQLLEDDA